jgi:hypothetical protein
MGIHICRMMRQDRESPGFLVRPRICELRGCLVTRPINTAARISSGTWKKARDLSSQISHEKDLSVLPYFLILLYLLSIYFGGGGV